MSHAAVQDFEIHYARHRRRTQFIAGAGWVIFLAAFVAAAYVSEISPARLAGSGQRLGEFIQEMLPRLDTDTLFEGRRTQGSIANWYHAFPLWAGLIAQSIEIALLSTVLGFVGAFLLSFPAARGLGTPPVVTFLVRRFLEILRTVPELVSALILVFAFGVGPLAGVVAITLHTIGALGKLFSEVHENADKRLIEGVRAAGGGWISRMRFGLVPQVFSNLASTSLLRFEINVAASTAIGVTGAGGIGMELRSRAIDLGIYQDAFAIILLIVIVIFAIDLISERLRTALDGSAP